MIEEGREEGRLQAELNELEEYGIKWDGDRDVRYCRILPWDDLDEEVREFAPAEGGEFQPINVVTDSQNFLWALLRRHPREQYQIAAAFWSICLQNCGFGAFALDDRKYLISVVCEGMEDGSATLHVS